MSLRKSERLAKLPAVVYYKKASVTRTPSRSSKRKQTIAKVSKSGALTANKKRTVSHISKTILPKDQGEIQNALINNLDTPKAILRGFKLEEAVEHLKKADAKLALLMTESSLKTFKQRLERAGSTDPFRALATSIIFQQISGKAAASIRTRFIKLFDSPVPVPDVVTSDFPWFPSPQMVLTKSVDELRSAGLSTRKAEYIRDLALKFSENAITAEMLEKMTDQEISKLLCSVRGIGQWTVDMYLMFDMGHPDVLPLTDLGIRKGLAAHFGLKSGLPSPSEMEQLTAPWRPFRTLGCWYMWRLMEIKTGAD